MKKCAKCGREYEDSAKFCLECGQALVSEVVKPEEKKTKGKKKSIIKTVILIVLIVILASSAALFAYAASEVQKQTNALFPEYNKKMMRAFFMDDYVVFTSITEDPNSLCTYHRFGCPEVDWSDCNAYDLEFAELLSNYPCPICCGN